MARSRGLLMVTMQLDGSIAEEHFHDWYNNEHAPLRLRLPFIASGTRFKALTSTSHADELLQWMAIYDVIDVEKLSSLEYTELRDKRSEREKKVFSHLTVKRDILHLVKEDAPRERLPEAVLVVRCGEKDDEAHRIDLSIREKYPFRFRHFKAQEIELYLYEFDQIDEPTLNVLQRDVASSKICRVYRHLYTAGPAPRDLQHLHSPFESRGTKTSEDMIESFVTTKDGVKIPYRLEGSTNPKAPLLVLSNSILVDWDIWDGFVESLSLPVRVLRYLTRGRSDCGETPVTLDLLASDVIELLDALRVDKAIVIGVSLGGVTALNAALKYPERITAFVACDTNSKSPPGNPKAWDDRIAIAEKDGKDVVGETLAGMTVDRWFTTEQGKEKVKEMVANNSLEGFKKGSKALYDYDLVTMMDSFQGRGLFVVGVNDGILPDSMQGMASQIGVDLIKIEDAGHLPMVEKANEFTAAITPFIEKSLES